MGMSLFHILFGPAVKLFSELLDSLFGGVGLDVLAVFLAGLLVIVEDLAV
jgi:hypothetical protein